MFRLMIADDEDAERMGIRFLLDKFGFEFDIREATNGQEALAKLPARYGRSTKKIT